MPTSTSKIWAFKRILQIVAASLLVFGVVNAVDGGSPWSVAVGAVGSLLIVLIAGKVTRDFDEYGPDHPRFSWRALGRRIGRRP